jgi:16S rRNA (uracil1498-N3)-methyltransferase
LRGFPVPDRFFSSLPLDIGEARLEGAEAHHLLHVLRAKAGAKVVLFDGGGAEFDATVERTDRTTVYLRIDERRVVDREPAMRLTLGVAMPKGDRQRWLVEKATELGVAGLVPLVTERGIAQPVGAALDRFRRSVVEAAKQCGRNRLMEIHQPRSLEEFCSAAPVAALRLIAHPGGATVQSIAATVGNANAKSAFGAIGPEGGFTEAEVQHAAVLGWTAVDLGARVLRVETAAIALAARLLI